MGCSLFLSRSFATAIGIAGLVLWGAGSATAEDQAGKGRAAFRHPKGSPVTLIFNPKNPLAAPSVLSNSSLPAPDQVSAAPLLFVSNIRSKESSGKEDPKVLRIKERSIMTEPAKPAKFVGSERENRSNSDGSDGSDGEQEEAETQQDQQQGD